MTPEDFQLVDRARADRVRELLAKWDREDAAVLAEVRKAALREAARSVCPHCLKGTPLIHEEDGWWHYELTDSGSRFYIATCFAEAIHALLEEPPCQP